MSDKLPSRARRARASARLAAVPSVLLVALLLVGCGKGGSPSSSASTPHTSSAPAASGPAPAGSITHAQAVARARVFARRVNLTAADVPGFTAAPPDHHPESPAERQLAGRLLSCAAGAGSARGGLPEVSSPQFTRRGRVIYESVSSSVSFASSAAGAAHELTVMRSARAKQCLAEYFRLLLTGKDLGGAVIGRVSVQRGSPPAPGTSGGYGWRVTALLQTHGLSVPFYLDVLGFVYGASEVTLQSSGIILPFPAAAQEELFKLLLRRARTQPL